MKGDKVFVDTNILVYAYDTSAGEKHKKAVQLMESFWNSGNGIISSQVVQEFFVNVTRKMSKPLDVLTAKEIVKDLLKWNTIIVNGEIILEAIEIQRKHKYSFWDAVIIESAVRGGVVLLLSEDLTDGQIIKGVKIKNPL
ncbi:MAG: PIN domain-containing protein [Nitrospirae bacterium]|nr:PIN domain-containing protein [Nitrospirota bacterium]